MIILGTAAPDPDGDHDGMPDGWKVQYYLDPLDKTDASKDADSDGYTNFLEYKKGTNPADPDSHPMRPMPWLSLLLE